MGVCGGDPGGHGVVLVVEQGVVVGYAVIEYGAVDGAAVGMLERDAEVVGGSLEVNGLLHKPVGRGWGHLEFERSVVVVVEALADMARLEPGLITAFCSVLYSKIGNSFSTIICPSPPKVFILSNSYFICAL